MSGINYRVHGMMQSYFTRKMTGYLDYKGILWRFRRFPGTTAAALAAGFPGGVPVVETPDGEFMWDSTAMIHHLELRFPEPAVLPPDPVQRSLVTSSKTSRTSGLYPTGRRHPLALRRELASSPASSWRATSRCRRPCRAIGPTPRSAPTCAVVARCSA